MFLKCGIFSFQTEKVHHKSEPFGHPSSMGMGRPREGAWLYFIWSGIPGVCCKQAVLKPIILATKTLVLWSSASPSTALDLGFLICSKGWFHHAIIKFFSTLGFSHFSLCSAGR
jgi:hypothetical protein